MDGQQLRELVIAVMQEAGVGRMHDRMGAMEARLEQLIVGMAGVQQNAAAAAAPQPPVAVAAREANAAAEGVAGMAKMPVLGAARDGGATPRVSVADLNSWMHSATLVCTGMEVQRAWRLWLVSLQGRYQTELRRNDAPEHLPDNINTLQLLKGHLTACLGLAREGVRDRDQRIRRVVRYSSGMSASEYIELFDAQVDATPHINGQHFAEGDKMRLFMDGLDHAEETCALLALKRAEINEMATMREMREAFATWEPLFCKRGAGLRAIAAAAAGPGVAGQVRMDVNAVANQRKGWQGVSRAQGGGGSSGGGAHGGGDRAAARRTDVQCFNCGKKGHMKRECRAPRQRGGRAFVREVGEGEDNDEDEDEDETQVKTPRQYPPLSQSLSNPKKKRESLKQAHKQQQHTMADADVVVLDPVHNDKGRRRMVWQGKVVNRKEQPVQVRVLIDSGASRNMVAESVAKQLLRQETGHQRTTFRFANGTVYTSDKYCPQVELDIQGKYKAKLDLLVCQLQNVDIILGMEWLEAENPDIDWARGTVTLRGEQSQPTAEGMHSAATEEDAPVEVPVRAISIEEIEGSGVRRLLRKNKVEDIYLLWASAATTAEEWVCSVEDEAGEKKTPPGVDIHVTPKEVRDAVAQHTKVFQPPQGLPPARPNHDHRIILQDEARPPFKHPFRLSASEAEVLNQKLGELLEKGYVRPSSSPFGAPVLLVKKTDGDMRLCIDYRALNKVTVRDGYPLPNIDMLIEGLSGAQWFSKVDCKAGYHLVRMREEDVPKTTFVTQQGAFEWRVMPMGLTNAPATFQRMMNDILRPHSKYAAVYLDDIIIFSASKEEHAEHVRKVLAALEQNDLRLHPGKCAFGRQEIHFLGHVITPGCVRMEEDKVEAVRNWAVPTTKKQLQSFLGFTNFYSDHVKNYAHITAPLTDLLVGAAAHASLPSPLPGVAIKAFEEIKSAMCKAPVLRMVERGRPFVVYTDASDVALGAVLMQDFADGRHPVAYKSRKLTGPERNYSARDRELAAVVYATKTWRHYLMGRSFLLYTDHESLQYLSTMDITGGGEKKRLARWTEQLQDYNFELRYVKGKDNIADGLTRNDSAREGAQDLEDNVMMTMVHVVVPGASEEELSNDNYFGPLVKMLKDGEQVAVQIKQRAREFVWMGDGLYKRDGERLRRCVAGQANQQALLQEYHNTPFGGHQGAERTYEALSADYYWQHMRARVDDWVAKCDSCQRNKPGHTAKSPLQPIQVPREPGECVTVDFMELPMSTRGNDFVMVCVDKLSKLVRVMPTTKSVTSGQSAELLLAMVLPTFGRVPASIISDRDPRFTAELWQAFWRRMGSTLNMTVAHRPQADGQTERANRQVQEYLRHFVSDAGSDWDAPATLAMLEFAINSHTSSTTETSAYKILLGRAAVTPAALGHPGGAGGEVKLEARWRAARDAIHNAQERMVANGPNGRNGIQKERVAFKAGDEVLLDASKFPQLKALRTSKLASPYYGPLKVKRVLSETTLQLEWPAGWGAHPTINIDSIKRFISQAKAAPPTPLVDSKGNKHYLVDKVVKMRVCRGVSQCRVRWKGYNESDDTWEPTSNIGKNFIEAYQATLPVQGNKAKKRSG